MSKIIELTNYEIHEFCLLSKKTGETVFYKGESKIPEFTGLYFRNDNVFFAIYPSEEGPMIFYKKRECKISKDLSIKVLRKGRNRNFSIKEYGISIDYCESQYIGFDSWSEEVDVDLFYMIEQNYLESSFYEQYTVK